MRAWAEKERRNIHKGERKCKHLYACKEKMEKRMWRVSEMRRKESEEYHRTGN